MGIGWLLICGLLIIGLQGFLFGRWALHRITYSRQFNVTTCHAGDQVEMVETIINQKALPVPWVRLEAMIPSHLRFIKKENIEINSGEMYQNHRSLFLMMPNTKITRKHKVRCEQRGFYSISTVAMTGGDWLGVIQRTKTLPVNAHIVVYPQLIPLEEIPLPAQSLQGDMMVRRWILEDPFLSAGVRDYAYGDTMNRIHWKASAKAGHLQVHKNDFTADYRLMIYLNIEVSKEMWTTVTDPELMEYGICVAASVAEKFISTGMEIGFGHNAHSSSRPAEPVRIEPAGGDHQLSTILHAMADIELKLRQPFDIFLEHDTEAMLPRTDYLFITTHVSDKISRQIDLMKQQGHRIEVLPLMKEKQTTSWRKEESG